MPSVDTVRTLTSDVYRWLLRPRVRLTVTGLVLLLSGAAFFTSSVWTLPLVIAGTLMVAIAWLGARLEGHFAVEFGSEGTQFHCGARVKPHPALTAPAPPQVAAAGSQVAEAAAQVAAAAGEPAAPRVAAGEPVAAAVTADAIPDADVVEGSAHTVEIEVAELEALIGAAGHLSKS